MELLFPHLTDCRPCPNTPMGTDTSSSSELSELLALPTVKQVTLCKDLSDLAEYIIEGREPENMHAIEIYSDRPFFVYEEDKRAYARCGNFNCSAYITQDRGVRSRKVRTYVSIVDVYDRYGIEACCSFIRRLYCAVQASQYPIAYLLRYVLGSIAVLDSVLARWYLCSLSHCEERTASSLLWTTTNYLIKTLVKKDTEQEPKMMRELEMVTHSLPTEVLALIFRSRRISKATSALFLLYRQNRTLREGELSIRSIIPPILCIDEYVLISVATGYALVVRDKVTLYRSPDDIPREDRQYNQASTISIYSWVDYARISRRSVKEVFLETMSRVDLSNIKHLAACVVCMLSSKISDATMLELFTRFEDATPQELTHSDLLKMYNDLYSQVMNQ